MAHDKPRWPRRIFLLVLLAALLGGGAWYLNTGRSDLPQYLSAPVTRGDLTQAVTANGTLNPVVNVQVGSQISGNIAKLFADFNSLVKSNQIVAQLDPAVFEAAVHQAQGDLANANATLELQQVEAKRSKALFDNKLISGSDYDQAVASLHQAAAQVKMKEAALERAQLDLDHCTIYAPVDGIVISRNVDVGQTVAASMNAPVLFQVANDLAKMQIDANVSEADVGSVEEGQACTFTVDAFPDRTFRGTVTQIRNSPVTVQNVVTYDTVIGVSNADLALKPGMTATLSIVSAQRTAALRIPNAALRFRPPELAPNLSPLSRLLAKIGLAKPAASSPTNNLPVASAAGTNKLQTAENAPAPLTGNEPPDELAKRVREMRQRGEEPPLAIRAKLRELYQSGVLQRPGQNGGANGGNTKPVARSGQPSWRTIYLLTTNTPPGGREPIAMPQAVRIKTGISDGIYTEVVAGLEEGASVVIAAKVPQAEAAAPTASPFGGGRRF